MKRKDQNTKTHTLRTPYDAIKKQLFERKPHVLYIMRQTPSVPAVKDTNRWRIIYRDTKAAAFSAPFAVGIPYFANNLALHFYTSGARYFPKGVSLLRTPMQAASKLLERLPANAVGAIVSKIGFLAPYYIINDLAKGSGYESQYYALSLAASGVVQSAATYHVRMDQITASQVSQMRKYNIKMAPNHFSQQSTWLRYRYYSQPNIMLRAYPRWLLCYLIANPATIVALDLMRNRLREKFPDWSDWEITLISAGISMPPLQLGLIFSNGIAARGMRNVLFDGVKASARGSLLFAFVWTVVQKTSEAAIAFSLGDKFKKEMILSEEESVLEKDTQLSTEAMSGNITVHPIINKKMGSKEPAFLPTFFRDNPYVIQNFSSEKNQNSGCYEDDGPSTTM